MTRVKKATSPFARSGWTASGLGAAAPFYHYPAAAGRVEGRHRHCAPFESEASLQTPMEVMATNVTNALRGGAQRIAYVSEGNLVLRLMPKGEPSFCGLDDVVQEQAQYGDDDHICKEHVHPLRAASTLDQVG